MSALDWLQLRRMIGINPATPLASQEGQIRYVRDGNTDGNLYVARNKVGSTMEWQPVNSVVVTEHGSQDSADTSSTASTTIYSTAITRSITLPAGTWTVRANGWITLIHSASLKATYRVKVDGTAGTAMVTENLSATLYSMWGDIGSKSGIVGPGAFDVVLEYHSSGAGTTSASNCLLWIAATRTA